MDQPTRFRINLSSKEIEIEGEEKFVRDNIEKFKDLIDKLVTTPDTVSEKPDMVEDSETSRHPKTDTQKSFGEYINDFPSSITQVDKILLAGYHVQRSVPDNSFTTAKANKVLIDNGIKLTNAADSIKKNKDAKRIFPISRGVYRVSTTGEGHIAKILKKK